MLRLRAGMLLAAIFLAPANAPAEHLADPPSDSAHRAAGTAGAGSQFISGSQQPRPGFAPELAERPMIVSAIGWDAPEIERSTGALVAAGVDGRQNWRWNLARYYIGVNRGSEAAGLLALMAQDDPDLPLVPVYRLAAGVAAAQADHAQEGLASLNHAMLVNNPEACAWRMRLLSSEGAATAALAELPCARTALIGRKGAALRPFLLAATRAAIATGDNHRAQQWLRQLGDGDAEANLLRGKAMLQSGQAQEGRLRLARVGLSGDQRQRIEAELSAMEAEVAAGRLLTADAVKRLDHICFTWRGDALEERALHLRYQQAEHRHDMRGQLSAGATLLRYHAVGKETGPMMAALQQQLRQLLGPSNNLPLVQAAGLFWDYRDLAPNGAEGDSMVNQLATQLQMAGLYERAAELLTYQMKARAQDIAKGPLAERIAMLQALSGRPDLAMRTLRETDGIAYPDSMRWSRQRLQAVILHLMGKDDAARAILADTPGGEGVEAEIAWQGKDWARLAGAASPSGARGILTEIDQTLVLRQAVAMAMLGRENDLAHLRTRYAGSFKGAVTREAFDLLTGPIDGLKPEAIARAMAAIPTASPAGELADLFELGRS
ncbi:MAG: hypothetical protein DI533_22075 [Cereibacter sphaeroides]|uniref:Uncharacterized protein n=1 Tax=Cereibacter sphaeroides TaxID=1063 RepID=A0A2W5S070_CERSP|nr:MAG: hypothetical protein DI533_22075 [Cereibacter sphaeroides]